MSIKNLFPVFFIAPLIAGIAFYGTAAAHPGPNILTAGAENARAATTPGVSYQIVNGVHLFQGATRLEGDKPAAPARHHQRKIEINLVTRVYPWRKFRRLRTQGFYSGTGLTSRRYTQGFYSGQ